MIQLLRSTTAYKGMCADAAANSCAHATLVVFPDESYLRPLLKECAKAFFGAADGSRESRLIEEESFSDCLFFPAAGEKLTAELGARILEESALKPVEAEKKLFVLDAFHTVTPLVQNKLLKVLEEPPAGVYFLLGASNEYSVLPTVRSRMKTIVQPPFSEERIEAALMRMHPGENGISEAAAACGGVYSAAEALLVGGGEDFRLAEQFVSGENTERLCREIGEKKEKQQAFFSALRLVLRDMLLIATGQGQYAARKGKELVRLAGQYPAGAIASFLALVNRAEREAKFNANLAQCVLSLAISMTEEKARWQTLS